MSHFSPFPSISFTFLENFLPFSSNVKLSSAEPFSLEESKVCYFGKGYNSLPNNKISDWSKSKAFADDKKKIKLKDRNSLLDGSKTLWEKEKKLVTVSEAF